jgi:hypothetical protein
MPTRFQYVRRQSGVGQGTFLNGRIAWSVAPEEQESDGLAMRTSSLVYVHRRGTTIADLSFVGFAMGVAMTQPRGLA